MSPTKSIVPPLDPGFEPAVRWNEKYRRRCEAEGGGQRVAIALERSDGTVSRFETHMLAQTEANLNTNRTYLERLVKALLWARGGYRMTIGAEPGVGEMIRGIYSETGERQFDYHFMGVKVYGRPFEVATCRYEEVPPARESARPLGRHLDGCRIGFDLGGSDRKCAAVIDGQCVFSEEVPWDPYFESDPQYHYDGINASLRRAAEHLPRVDAIGGSAAGVYVANEVRAASLFRGVSQADFEKRVRRMFFDLQKEWGGVPFEVANDGDVTALAGSMALGENSVLGISMGTSVAGGYVTPDGSITPWLNELAFIPVDYREDAPADEWSGDRGCAVQYFCQQGVARLAPMAGIEFSNEMKFAERLVEVQKLMAGGDHRARAIYETAGICFGYFIAHCAEFYDVRHLLVLGRVTSGEGGGILLQKAREVLRRQYPQLDEQIQLHTPDEKDKRHGQAVAAASLPELRN